MTSTTSPTPRRRPPVAATNETIPSWYPQLLHSVASRVATTRVRSLTAVNRELVAGYWAVGRDILDRQESEGWGARVIDRLSVDLRERFPGSRGYSPRNLKLMRAFAAVWAREQIVQEPLAQLPWYHHVALLQKLRDPEERLWYAAASVNAGWSHAVLVRQIDSGLRGRSATAVHNFAEAPAPHDSDLVAHLTRDPYVFDIVGLDAAVRERDLERALVDHIEQFLLGLGQGFAFVGRQVLLEIDEQQFYADLLFYHLDLRRYVVIELKPVAFDPSFIGQLSFYMAAIDDLRRHVDDQPTVGLLLCKTKNDVVAEYALRGVSAPIGVAEWREAVVSSLPAEVAGRMPTVEQLEAELAGTADKAGDS